MNGKRYVSIVKWFTGIADLSGCLSSLKGRWSQYNQSSSIIFFSFFESSTRLYFNVADLLEAFDGFFLFLVCRELVVFPS